MIKSEMKTHNEACASYDPDIKDFGVKVRPRRQGKNLPNAFDDIARIVDNSWKRHRKSQWR